MEGEQSEIKEQKGRKKKTVIRLVCGFLLIVLAFVLAACDMPLNSTGNSGNNTKNQGKKDNPVEIYGNDVPKLKEGQWIRISAPAEGMRSDDGSMFNKFEGSKEKTVFIKYELGENKRELDIYAEHALPGKYKEDFASHPPADFNFEPTFVNGEKYSGCRITMLGKIKDIVNDDEAKKACYLEDGAIIEKLEFFY